MTSFPGSSLLAAMRRRPARRRTRPRIASEPLESRILLSATVEVVGENSEPVSTSDATPAISADAYDLNDDDVVDFGDVALFLTAFLRDVDEPGNTLGRFVDYDESGFVDFADLATMLPNFLARTGHETPASEAARAEPEGSRAAAFATGVRAAADERLAASSAEASVVVGLDAFRSDPRFADVDGRGTAVVVIDTGIDLDHPAFGPDADGNGVADRIVHQYDFVNDDADVDDVHGHGTSVAGVIGSVDAARPGLAPGANLIVLKVLDDFGGGTFADTERALQWVVENAAAHNVVAVNLSLGDGGNHTGPVTRYGLGDELATLAELGVVAVSSAGNNYFAFDSSPGAAYPAADPNSLSVGAVFDANVGGVRFGSGAEAFSSAADRIAPFSQRHGTLASVMAPGVNITGPAPGGGAATWHGTSQATPHVTAAVLLAQQLAERELGRRLTLDEIDALLQSTGERITDGDDEQDNVTNTGLAFRRVDLPRLAEGVLQLAEANRTTYEVQLSGGTFENGPAGFPTSLTLGLAPGDAADLPEIAAFNAVLRVDPDADVTFTGAGAAATPLFAGEPFVVPGDESGPYELRVAHGLVGEPGRGVVPAGEVGLFDAHVSVAAGVAGPIPIEVVELRLFDGGGNAIANLDVADAVLEVAPGVGPTIDVRLVNDTGVDAGDGLTRNATIVGTVEDASGVAEVFAALDGGEPVRVDSTGQLLLTPPDLRAMNGGERLSEGPHTVTVTATDVLGNTSDASVPFVLDTRPPDVASIVVDATEWTAAFRAALAAILDVDPRGLELFSSPYSGPLSWTGLDRLSVAFDEPVVLTDDALVADGLDVEEARFRGETAALGVWTFAAPFVGGTVTVGLAEGVTDLAGNPLVQAVPELAAFEVRPGDANGDRRVDGDDTRLVRRAQFAASGSPRYSVFADANGDAAILGDDLVLVRNRREGEPADAIDAATCEETGSDAVSHRPVAGRS